MSNCASKKHHDEYNWANIVSGARSMGGGSKDAGTSGP